MARTATVEPDAPATSASPLDQILSVLQDMSSKVESLTSKVEVLESRQDRTDQMTPRLQPMNNDEMLVMLGSDPVVTRGKDATVMEGNGQRGNIRMGPSGRPLRPDIANAFQPTFKVGQLVRLNPEARHYGWPEAQKDGSPFTWAHRLAKYNSDGLGIIKRYVRLASYPDGTVVHRYKVFVNNITKRDGNDFDEDELLPA